MNEIMKTIALLVLIFLPATSALSSPVKSFAAQAASSQTYDCGGISSAIRAAEVWIPQRGGGTLNAKIFAPDSAAQTAPCPLISMLPGGGAGISSVEWAARRLAAVGYIVIITKPLLGGSLDSYNTAAISGIDFILSPANPYLPDTKTDTIGVAGWSLGARALSRTQEEDARIDALVAWDNLAVSETGDAGSPACTNMPATLRTPRVPALGQASETCADGRPPDAKKIAFERWRADGVPSMEVVFAGATHFFWSAQAPEHQHDIAHYYTQAWFDRWLKGDSAATQRLTARTILGTNLDLLLSGAFNSAAFFDGYDCANLRSICQLACPSPVLLTEQDFLGIPVTASSGSSRCNLESRIAELEQQLAAANQTIQTQQTTIATLQNQVTTLSQQVASLQSQLTAANNQVAALTETNAQLQTTITNFINAVQQDLRQTFNNPQFTIAGATPTGQLQSLQTALQNLKRSSKQNLYKTLGGR